MAQHRTESELTWQSGAVPERSGAEAASDPTDAALSASAEFRELARQRRFVRGGESDVGRVLPDSTEGRAISSALNHAADRVAAAHEQLARATARAEHAEKDLEAANNRLMAANILVQDAQRATHQTAERCAWLEGRNEALQEALEVAVHASMVTRWRWRRQLAASKKAKQS